MQNLKKVTGQKTIRFLRRKHRINAKIKDAMPDFRILIQRSNLYVKAQVIAKDGQVIAQITDKGLAGQTKLERARLAGATLAGLMKKASIDSATFDRNGYLYHGRVAAFADGLRDGGIQI